MLSAPLPKKRIKRIRLAKKWKAQQATTSSAHPTFRYIAPEALPVALGGTLRDDAGDPDCKRIIGGGGAVPLAYVVGVATDGRGLGEVRTACGSMVG
jgi:hypothetical protein